MTVDAILQNLENLLNSNFLSLGLQAVIAYLAILWIAIIIWVTKDANNRSNSLPFQVFSILIVILLTPLFGLLIYLIIRPSKTLTEKYLEQSQIQLLNEEEQKEEQEKCSTCQAFVDKDHIFCGNCGTKLKKACPYCKKPYNADWTTCPYCGKKEKPKKISAKKEPEVESEMKEIEETERKNT